MVNIADRNQLIKRIRDLSRDRDNLYKQLNAMDKRHVADFNRLNGSGHTNAAWRLEEKYRRAWRPLRAQAERMDSQIEKAKQDLWRAEHGR